MNQKITPNKEQTLAILEKEKDYETKFAEDLNNYFLKPLNQAIDLTEEEKQKINEALNLIIEGSESNVKTFEKLIDSIEKDGTDSY